MPGRERNQRRLTATRSPPDSNLRLQRILGNVVPQDYGNAVCDELGGVMFGWREQPRMLRSEVITRGPALVVVRTVSMMVMPFDPFAGFSQDQGLNDSCF